MVTVGENKSVDVFICRAGLFLCVAAFAQVSEEKRGGVVERGSIITGGYVAGGSDHGAGAITGRISEVRGVHRRLPLTARKTASIVEV